MILPYRLAFLPALLVLLPAVLPRMLRRGGLRAGFGQRFGAWARLPPPPAGVRRVWIQAVSVGEMLAIAPLVARLRARPDVELVISTTTTTGHALGRERYGPLGVEVGYFPLDFLPFSARAWCAIRPDLVVLTESELWPEHLAQARRRGVPVVVINARISDRSFARLRRFAALVRPLVAGIDRILAASAEDAARLAALGFAGGRIEVSGNLKLDVAIAPVLDAAGLQTLRAELGLPDGLILMGSSTWPGEEEALLGALHTIRAAGVACRLLLVPRHAERREEVSACLRAAEFTWHRRTLGPAPSAVDVCLADTTGEMVRLLQTADVVFVGRSLAPHDGGQTPVEAAALGRPVLFGPFMTNFRRIARQLGERGAALVVRDAEELAREALRLVSDPAARAAMGAAGVAWHRANRGAIERTLRALETLLDAPRPAAPAEGGVSSRA